MIFVLIGILILIVSFAIALVSLVKEQRNVDFFEEADTKNISSARVNDISQLQTASTPKGAHVENERKDEFPWGNEFKVDGAGENLAKTQEEVARIKAELARIQAEKRLSQSKLHKDQGLDEDSTNEGKRRRLNGDFSVRELVENNF